LKQNQRDVNDAMGSKKKTVVVTSGPLALIADRTKVSKSKEKVVISSDSEGSEADDFNELKKINALLAKAFNRRKFYSKPTNNNLRTSSTSQSANKKQEFVKTDNKKVEKKDDEKKRDMSRVKCYNWKKEGHFAKDCKKVKVNDYEYYKTKMLLAKKYKDEQVFLAEDQAWMESSSDSDQEINANMVFMAQIEKVFSDSEASSSYADKKISEVSYYLSKSESESEFETSEYYDNSTNYGLFVNNDDDQEIFHDAIESASENLIENHIDSQKDYDKSDKRIEKANQQSKDFENQNKDLQDKYDVLKNQATIFEMNNKELNEQLKELTKKNNDLLAQTKAERYEYMIRYSAYFDNDKQHRKQIADQEVLYDKMSAQLVELDKHIYFEDDYFQEIINPDFEKIDSPFQQTSSLKPYVPNVILEKIIIDLEDEVVNLLEKEKVIAPRMFKLSVSQSVLQISMSKTSCDYKNVEIKLKIKRRKRKSSKQNVKQVDNDVSRANSDFVHFSDLDTFSSVRRLKNSGVIWKKKGSSNTSNVDLSAVSVSKLNKNVKRYSRKDLMGDLLDDNNLFIFDDESVRISPVSKMPFRKKAS
nr:hypothetical protein [Tanacetum cinerariifolium]